MIASMDLLQWKKRCVCVEGVVYCISEDCTFHRMQNTEMRIIVQDEDVSIQDLYNCDESVLTTDYKNVEQIYNDIVNENADSDEEGEVENTENETLPLSYAEATSTLDVLRRYIISSNMEDGTFNMFEKLEEKITKTRTKMKQSIHFDFF